METSFEGSFAWKGAGRATASSRQMKLVLASAELAHIVAGDSVVAVCRVKPEDTSPTGRAIASVAPRQVDFDCEAAQFQGLTGPATLILRGRGNPTPLLRFGTWLDGYRNAPLKVMTDHLSAQPEAAFEVPVRSDEELAKRVQRKPAIALQSH